MTKSNYAEVDESNVSNDSDKEIGLQDDPTDKDVINNSFY